MPCFNCAAFWGVFDCGPFSDGKININAMLRKAKKETRVPSVFKFCLKWQQCL